MKMYELIIIKKWISLYTKDFVLKLHIKNIIIYFFIYFLRLPCNYNLLKPKEKLLNTNFFLRFMFIFYIIKVYLFFALYYFINNYLILINHFLIRNQCFLMKFWARTSSNLTFLTVPNNLAAHCKWAYYIGEFEEPS